MNDLIKSKPNSYKMLNHSFWVISIMLLLVQGHKVQAQVLSPQGITLQGTILDAGSFPVEEALVAFTLKIKSAGVENCLLYEETQNLNMTSSGGAFSLTLGQGTRSGANFEDISTLAQVFNNNSSAMTVLTCDSGTTYTSASTDTRKVEITFDDGTGSGPQTLSQMLSVQSVPYALNSDTLEGKAASQFVQTVDGNTQTRVADILNTRWTALDALINGTSTLYAGDNGANFSPSGSVNFNSQALTNLAAPSSGTDAANKTYADGNIGGVTADTTAIGSLGNVVGDIGKNLSWDGTQWTAGDKQWVTTGSDVNYDSGNVGVGVAVAPVTKLEVNGTLKVGDGGETCDASKKGSIRYNNTSSVLEYCNSSVWVGIEAGTCSDANPVSFSFNNEANASLSTLYTSNILQITGVNCTVPLSVSGNGSPQFRTCSDASCMGVVQDWTTGPSSISVNEYLQVRLTSDAAGGSNFQATLILGAGASVWSVTTTGSCASSPVPGTVCADGTIYAGDSPDGSVPMYTTRCDRGQTWDGSNCTGTRLSLSWNDGGTAYISTGYTNPIPGQSNSSGLAAILDGANADAPFYAAQNCESLNQEGFTDWYLPGRTELGVLYTNNAAIRNFANSTYWSSTESSNGNVSSAYRRDFSSGSDSNGNKNNTYYVRCVRR
ncbi:MAG: DUF1566 domain-containing protein [Bdellovibrionaceae bacterium]|mgnify:CR=1 FL=1|jgi:hypothetical protein|nr:DUF1566 domain-containing protein [Pseudobdellovibrionaceae bacterium]